MKILFLCHGNICRSPMAEYVMKYLLSKENRTDVIVASAALHDDEIGSDIHRGTKAILTRENIPFFHRAAWRLTAEKAREYDLLIGMDDYNIFDLRHLVYPEDISKIHKLLEYTGDARDVADPWYTHNFETTYRDILAGCTALLNAIS